MKQFKLISLVFIALVLLNACDNRTEGKVERQYQDSYVDFERFKEGRPCAEVKFMCLPESQDKSWQSIPTEDKIADLEITPKVEIQYDLAIKASNKQYHAYMKIHPNATRKEIMLLSSLDRDFFEKVDAKRFLVSVETRLEKEFPGFWRDVAKPVRYRWIRRAMNKAKKFGYKSSKPGPMMELCARIGLDFDKDPKWDDIVKFIISDPRNIGTHMGKACNYIDWTILNKTHAYTGTKITDWSMRRVNGWLPSPKIPYPKL